MKRTLLITAAAASISLSAHAQTLDAQMQRMQSGQPASPANAAPAQWPALRSAPAQQPPALKAPAQPAPTQPAPATQMPAPAQDQFPAPAAQAAPTQAVSQEDFFSAIPALPLEVMQSPAGVKFVNGGIGDEEMAQLKSIAPQYNLHIMLSAPGGAYISDVRLRLLLENGQPVLDVADAGPHLYAQVQPGIYLIEAYTPTVSVVKKIKISVPKTGTSKQSVVFDQH